MYNSLNIKYKIIRLATILVVIFTIIIGVYFVGNYGFITIDIEGEDGYSVSIYNDSYSKNIDSYDNQSKILIKKSNYNIVATNTNETFLASVKSKGFIQTLNTKGQLTREYGAKRIVTNPNRCVVQADDKIYSLDCINGGSSLTTHHPASAESPSHQDTEATHLLWKGEIINIDGQDIGLAVGIDGEIISISKFPSGEIITSNGHADKLRNTSNIGIKKYLDGFIVYSKDAVEVYYYRSLSGEPTRLGLADIAGSEFNVVVYKQFITYNHLLDLNLEDSSIDINNQEISVYDGGQSFVQQTSKGYKNSFYCATNRVCSLTTEGDRFITSEIINEKKLKTIYEYYGVTNYHSAGKDINLVGNTGLINYNPVNGTGFYSYTYNPSVISCGLYEVSNKTAICILDVDGNQQVSLLSSKFHLSDNVNIDGKISELENNDNIDVISVDGNFIYINTSVIPVYNEELGVYAADPEELQYAKDNINRAIDEIGVDRNVYTIIIL